MVTNATYSITSGANHPDSTANSPSISPVTALRALPIYRFQVTKRVWLKILCVLGILILLPVLTLFSMITMYVNKIPIFTLLRILIQWAMAGA